MPRPDWTGGREYETQEPLAWEAPVHPCLPDTEETPRMLSAMGRYKRRWLPATQGNSLHQELAGTLTLDFPGSRTMRNKCLLFQTPKKKYPKKTKSHELLGQEGRPKGLCLVTELNTGSLSCQPASLSLFHTHCSGPPTGRLG